MNLLCYLALQAILLLVVQHRLDHFCYPIYLEDFLFPVPALSHLTPAILFHAFYLFHN